LQKDQADQSSTIESLKQQLKDMENSSASNFTPFTYSGTDENGKSVFYRDGKQYTFEAGINPYTGTKNTDAKNGTFSNGYQPDNIGGKKLSKTGYTATVNGVTQNVWKTERKIDSGRSVETKYYVWDGTKNAYEEVEV
jgi:hypothetical protein